MTEEEVIITRALYHFAEKLRYVAEDDEIKELRDIAIEDIKNEIKKAEELGSMISAQSEEKIKIPASKSYIESVLDVYINDIYLAIEKIPEKVGTKLSFEKLNKEVEGAVSIKRNLGKYLD
ncbi:MAG: hypothetical protein GWN01_05325 [Nitrosopumilaceae archaeon]|nr:hypothetical protein [Nitrosopumilaceae archaeon]NIU00365.1 hypothetical protein [Nitrosopumilaceae archaeon]NIU86767.1 hypothetical protein [Nitrosopumilaceae archaeon]NIV65467.1 hypothetical protein [Nitrosopumilaceae archaeon]NIX60967.1 hypothetical protein [Nitrosopumilaceae archaeon]